MPPPLDHGHSPNLQGLIKESLCRPAQLLLGEPIVSTIAMMVSVTMCLIYIFTEALQPIYQTMGFSYSNASLLFMAIGVGMSASTFTRILDFHVLARKSHIGRPIKPEDKLLGLAIGAPVLTIGLWWFGWTIPPIIINSNISWLIPTIALVLVGYGLMELDTVLHRYILDSYLSYSASATAAVMFTRALLSGVAPLFTRYMFNGLNANVAISCLAGVATIFCIMPPLILSFGEQIRRHSPFAKYSWEVQEAMAKELDKF